MHDGTIILSVGRHTAVLPLQPGNQLSNAVAITTALLGACPNICSCSRMAAGFRWALAFSASAQPCAHYPPQSTPTPQERRQIFKRLWVKHISCHSADTFSRPRNRNLRIPRADLIMPNTGSTMCLRPRRDFFASRRTQFALHLFLRTRFGRGCCRFGRGRCRLGRNRCFVVLLSTCGDVRVDAHFLQLLDRFFAEVAGVGRVRNRRGRPVRRFRLLNPCRVQVVQGRLGHRHGLLLVIRLIRCFRRHDDRWWPSVIEKPALNADGF